MSHSSTLAQLAPGESAVVLALETPHRQRLTELGFCPGSRVTCLQESPWGDPVAYGVSGAVIALRLRDAAQILVQREDLPCPR